MKISRVRSAMTFVVALTLGTLVASQAPLLAQERLAMIPAEKMTDVQKKAVTDYKAIRGTDLTGPPWSLLLRVPDLVVPSLQIRLHYLNSSALSPKLTEFAILIAARQWTNNFEFNAHTPAALKGGLKQDVVTAIAEGRRPLGLAEDEEVLYDFSMELQANQSVSDATYARALAKLGEAGVVEMAGIQGYYTYLAMVMNAARVGMPGNAAPPLQKFPR